MTPQGSHHVQVLIVTRDRPDALRRCVAGTLDQVAELSGRLGITIVENNASLTIQDTLAPELERGRSLGVTIALHCEPEPGVSAVRNRAVREALANGAQIDHLAFIDDDEVPLPGWIMALVGMARSSGASVVAGPVVAVPPPGARLELLESGVFDRRSPPAGTRLRTCAAGNVLVDPQVFRSLEGWFDPALGTTGGEDTAFFARASRAGHAIVWSPDAVVEEHLPPDRYTVRYVVGRSFQTGLGRGAAARTPRTWLRTLAIGLLTFSRGAGGTLIATRRGRLAALAELRHAISGVGVLAGLLGVRRDFYGR